MSIHLNSRAPTGRQIMEVLELLLPLALVQRCSPKKKWGTPETRLRQRFLNNLGLHDTRCYFNVRSKADISQLNLPPTYMLY